MKDQYQNKEVANVIRLPEVIKRKNLPRSIRLGERSVGWLEHEISAWIESRAALRNEVSHV